MDHLPGLEPLSMKSEPLRFLLKGSMEPEKMKGTVMGLKNIIMGLVCVRGIHLSSGNVVHSAL